MDITLPITNVSFEKNRKRIRLDELSIIMAINIVPIQLGNLFNNKLCSIPPIYTGIHCHCRIKALPKPHRWEK